MPRASARRRPRIRGSCRHCPRMATRPRFGSECPSVSRGSGVIAACFALALWTAASPAADSLPYVLRRDGGFERLSQDPSRPVEPVGFTFDSFGRVFSFDATGAFVRGLGGPVGGSAALTGVAGVAVARRGDLFVSESPPGRIVRLDPTGAQRAAWALPESTDAERLPIAVDDSM